MNEVDLLSFLPSWTRVFLDMRVTTSLIMIATAINVLVSYMGSRASAKSADAAHRSSDAAEKSAKLAKASVDVSVKAMEVANRPYLALQHIGIPTTDPDDEAIVPVNVRVLGKLPIVIKECVLKYEDYTSFIAPGRILMPSESIQTITFFPHNLMLAEYKAKGAVGLKVKIGFEAVGLEIRYMVAYDGILSTEGFEVFNVSMT